MSLAPLHYLLDKKAEQSRRVGCSYVSLARFSDAVKPYVSILYVPVSLRAYACNESDNNAYQEGVQINHGRGPPFSLTVSRVSLCPI